ncbi:MAG: radical SAM protein [Candidatus Palauibacterales bacterium]|nr:radical SAM protein [Candidatus Palauibacterales bacterium]
MSETGASRDAGADLGEGDGFPSAYRDAWEPGAGAETAGATAAEAAEDSDRDLPHVVAWNLTARCNLECPHCYISAGSWRSDGDDLSTEECRRITDQVLDVNPAPLFVLSGGEPLVRDDLEEIAAYASGQGATVVVGTNGTLLTRDRIASLKDAGVRGVAISVDSLDPDYHDRFRRGAGALEQTLAAVERLREGRLDFVVQTTLTRANREEVPELVAWAAEKGAVCFNLYFLVGTGRGEGMASDGRLTGLSPEQNEEVLAELAELQREYRGRLMIRSKCQPQLMRHVHERDPDSPLLNYRTRCPCGVQYCRITPEGKVTPCPYMPEVAGDLREASFGEVWRGSELFRRLREESLGGKCGRCAYRELCGGCRARAHAETGDPMGPDESCAYEPDGREEAIQPPREITYGESADREMPWTEDAEERLERVPSFVRGVVANRLEDYARRKGESRVTAELMTRVRKEMPIDFSERMPFFARGGEGDGDE